MALTDFENNILSADPYRDDFDEDKNFLRILFNPSRAVQARELTQAQTILANQIRGVSNHIFAEGTPIIDARIKVDSRLKYIEIGAFSDVGGTSPVVMSNYDGKYIKGDTSGGIVLAKYVGEGATRRIHVEQIGGMVQVGERFTSYNSAADAVSGNNAQQTGDITLNDGLAVRANLDSGLIYAGGSFVIADAQEVIVDASVTTESYNIGYLYNEEIVTSNTDSSLLDPANGAPNFNAPGADRYKGSLTLASYATSTTPPDNFYTIVEYDNEVLVSVTEDVQYANILDLLARRTYDESGSYSVEEFDLEITNKDDNELTLNLSPGKAYVMGYEVETRSTVRIDIPKARTTSTLEGEASYLSYGSYVVIDQATTNGIIPIENRVSVNLMNGSNGTGTLIGTAKAVSITRSGSELRLWLGGNISLRDLLVTTSSIIDPVSGAYINVESFNNSVQPTNVAPIIELNQFPVSSLDGVNVSTSTTKVVNAQAKVGNTWTITADDNFTDFNVSDAVIMVTRTDTGALLTETTDYTVATDNSAGDSGASTITITDVPTTINTSINVVIKETRRKAYQRTKDAQENTYSFTSSGASETLPHADMYEIVSVYNTTSDPSKTTDIQDTLTFDDGQRDYSYELASIASGLDGSSDYEITYRYWNHSGSASTTYFSANSYTDSGNLHGGLHYEMIGNYTTEDGKVQYSLRDSMDFRRSAVDILAGVPIIHPNATTIVDYDYYLSRNDLFYVTPEGEFSTITGIPEANPFNPPEFKDSMTLFEIQVPAYTFSPESVKIIKRDHKNYTMNDIRRLEDRIQNLEYYTALSIQEKSAEDLAILDANGNDRFKNGIMVDNFDSFEVAELSDDEWRAVLDFEEGILRCPFEMDQVQMENNQDAGAQTAANIKVHDHIVTLDYTEGTYMDQPLSSEWMNVNPYAVFKWIGSMTLKPASDNWVDTTRAPAMRTPITEINTSVQNMLNRTGLSSPRWNSWQTEVTGRSTRTWTSTGRARWTRDNWWTQSLVRPITTTTQTSTTTRRTRTGTQLQSSVSTVNRSLGDRVIDTSIARFIRSRAISYTVTGMKPNMTLKAYFDEVDVDAHCSNLIVDANGDISGTFTIPAGQFRTGTLEFMLIDDLSVRETVATARYSAIGIVNTTQESILAIDVPQFSNRTLRQSDSSTSISRSTRTTNQVLWRTNIWDGGGEGGGDPLAQSFHVNESNGVFLSSIDLYFKSKSDTIPVSVIVVPTSVGYPTKDVLPYSETSLTPASVNTSEDGSVSTTFTFSDPVYLKGGLEYAFIVMANTTEYEVFVGNIGSTELISGKVIDKQPHTGSLFKSQNLSTWTADQDKDLKFKLRRCVFDNASSGTYDTQSEDLSEETKATLVDLNTDVINIGDTTVTSSYKFTSDSGYTTATLKENYILPTQYTLDAGSTPVERFFNRHIMTSPSDLISPVISTQRSGSIMVNNLTIDKGSYHDAGVYVSRAVNITEPADDVRIVLDAKVPAGGDIVCSYRTTNFTPKYVEIDSAANKDLINEICDVYHRSNDGPTFTWTKKGQVIVTGIDTDATPDKVYLSSIGDYDDFINSADFATNSLDSIYICKDPIDQATMPAWTGSESPGDYVVGSDDQIYVLEIGGVAGIDPTTPGQTSWTKEDTMSTTTIVTTEDATAWRPMELEQEISAEVDTVNNFVEYVFIPTIYPDEEFTEYAVKIEMRSTGAVQVPEVKNLKAISVY